MPKLINPQAELLADDYSWIADADQIPSDNSQAVLVPLLLWQSERERLRGFSQLGIVLGPDEFAELIAADLNRLTLVAIGFPKFVDGRGYSTARLLRERYNFTGDLRAQGDVLLDQLHFLRRCGFNQFALRDDQNLTHAAPMLSLFNDSYQSGCDQPQPLFRRRALA